MRIALLEMNLQKHQVSVAGRKCYVREWNVLKKREYTSRGHKELNQKQQKNKRNQNNGKDELTKVTDSGLKQQQRKNKSEDRSTEAPGPPA